MADKDIEKVNKLWYLLDDVYSTGLIENEERDEYQQALGNILEELEILKRQVDIDNIILEKQDKELETYKKIAEFLADEGEFNSNKYCDEDGLVCMVKHPERECTKCIIDWARNEVKNEIQS